MKKLALATLALSMAACTSGKGTSAPVPKFSKHDVVSNEFLVAGNEQDIRASLAEIGVTVKDFELLDEKTHYYAVSYEGSADLETVMNKAAEKATSIEPNRVMHNRSNLNKYEWPTDKMFMKQWALNNIGQSAPFSIPGERNADMDILNAWKKTQGSSEVVVGVIDTGCDYTHPELKNAIKINEKEAPANGGIAGVDDDANGYVDDVYGYNFVSSDLTQPYYGIAGRPDPMDDNDHGTHCSGAIAAEANNGIGVAGVAPGVKLICVKIGSAQGSISTKDAFRGIRYARARGVQIMTNSWGGPGEYDSSLLNSEILEVEKAGILFVVAAGNDGQNLDLKNDYPARLKMAGKKEGKYRNVLVVGASDNQDNPASFSNYGIESVDVFAPGVMILSTVPNKTGAESGTYAVMSGTSMATPYVAGVAALMMSNNPSLRGHPEDVIRIIDQSADVKESLVGKAISNGRINANRALEQSVNVQAAPTTWVEQGYNLTQRGYNKELVDIRHEIKVAGAKLLKVHFNFVDIQEPYDSLYIYDSNYRLITTVQSIDTTEFWSPTIPGDTMYIRFVNSKVQQVTVMPIKMKSESECSSKGASNITRLAVDSYICDTDSTSSGDAKKPYVTFNSEGFSVDRVAYSADSQTVTKN